MSDYIKREDAIREIKEWAVNLHNPTNVVLDDAICVLQDMLPADVVEVRHGRWEIIYKHSEIATLVKCSECGHERYIQTGEEVNYCPNCGAKMDGENDE